MVPPERPAAGSRLPTPVLTVTGLAVLAVVAAATGGPWTFTLRLPLWETPGPPPPRTDSGPPLQAGPGDGPVNAVVPVWLTVALVIVLVLLAIGAAIVIWRVFPRRRIRPADAPAAVELGEVQPDVRRLQEGALAALDLLDGIGDPKDAVVRAWTALETAAERSGVPRDPAATPSEFTATVLTSTAADPDAVERLLALYHRARFSSHAVGIDDVRVARACVLDLSRTWRGYDDALRASVP